MEFREVEILENIGSYLGQVFIIDYDTLILSHAKFVCMCIEIDLSKPVKHHLWVGEENNKALVAILYE